MLGKSKVTFEEQQTLLCKDELILNKRTLTFTHHKPWWCIYFMEDEWNPIYCK